MLAILVAGLGLVAVGAWFVALFAAVGLWRALPAGHRLKGFFDLGWLKFDTIREMAGPEADRYTRRYVYALVVFFVTLAALLALMVAIYVTGQNGGTL